VLRSRDGDQHQGKYNGLGGKLEAHEDVVGCLHRELMEEAMHIQRSGDLRAYAAKIEEAEAVAKKIEEAAAGKKE